MSQTRGGVLAQHLAGIAQNLEILCTNWDSHAFFLSFATFIMLLPIYVT